jgi:integrase
MKRKKLSAVSIPTLPPRHDPYPDPLVPGLGLRVGKNRSTWLFRYRAGGKKRNDRLGYFPAMGLADARTAARKHAERIDAGTPAPPAAPHPRSALTLGTLIDKYEALRSTEGVRVRSLPEAMASLRRNLKPWLTLPAAEFSKNDLRSARDAVAEGRGIIAANRLIAYLGPVLRWAAEEDLIAVNFASAVRRAPEAERTRKLTDAEIIAIWQASDTIGTREAARSYGRLVKFLLLTAQRRDECASLRFGDILNGVWRQTQNKSDRPHAIPLSSLALTLVGQGTAQALVFPGRSGKLSGYSKMKAELDRVSGVTGWVLHDSRRSTASRMQDLGVRRDIIEAILNHAVPGAGLHYLQAELEAQKREALAIWATALTKIVRPMALVVA